RRGIRLPRSTPSALRDPRGGGCPPGRVGSPGRLRRRERGSSDGRRGGDARQVNGDTGAVTVARRVAGRAFHGNTAAMPSYDVVDQRQPESRSGDPRLLGVHAPIKLLEYPRVVFDRDADAEIAHRDSYL